jgi:hypothetical protein
MSIAAPYTEIDVKTKLLKIALLEIIYGNFHADPSPRRGLSDCCNHGWRGGGAR